MFQLISHYIAVDFIKISTLVNGERAVADIAQHYEGKMIFTLSVHLKHFEQPPSSRKKRKKSKSVFLLRAQARLRARHSGFLRLPPKRRK